MSNVNESASRALPESAVTGWDREADVVVVGYGCAGASAAIVVALLALLCHSLARIIGTYIGQHLDKALHTEGFDHIAPAMAALFGQAPTILVYGYMLGLQIAI